MQHIALQLQNVKCGGCANQILTKVKDIDGVQTPKLDVPTETLTFNYANEQVIHTVRELVQKMGYPTADADNTLTDKAKSYVSCMIGRVRS